MANKKPVSEIRQYCEFLNKIRLAKFLVIPITVALYMWLASEKNIFLGMICAIFPYFFSIIIGQIILNRRYTDEQAIRLARFDSKYSGRLIKQIKKETLILIGLVATGHLTMYFLNINTMTVSFIPVLILGVFVIVFRFGIRDPNHKFDNDEDQLGEEYEFNSYSPSQTSDNFLMDPGHPSSLLNPTNPASPVHQNHH